MQEENVKQKKGWQFASPKSISSNFQLFFQSKPSDEHIPGILPELLLRCKYIRSYYISIQEELLLQMFFQLCSFQVICYNVFHGMLLLLQQAQIWRPVLQSLLILLPQPYVCTFLSIHNSRLQQRQPDFLLHFRCHGIL